MDIKRAEAILQSPEEIEVKYEGKSVWLESVNPINAMVEITNHRGAQAKRTVPVDELKEIGFN
ncbi:H-type small acid-soluble spore protein [Serpentinicella sp. ANB-PHB4]|uniref:H-type small acid-soluble spore protein n=1 Tax=Serpentinicella sp. ANB-PHB4 TaxID=3074076 RepID=UPI00286722D5|nr:H-type small acid-soluble spore protein [Serpentinicella sp. ANB-PHB4]MDR5659472.1 H-type small acid-soluble spore protein [Serpentinicella sp. ANB-PHB4]